MNPTAYLKDQLNKSDYTEKEWDLIEYLIQNLDDDGFYPYPVEKAAKIADVTEEEAKKCLEDLRGLEPCGILPRILQNA
mgnify:FL=1